MSITYFHVIKYSELISPVQTLYHGLLSSDPTILSALTAPGFTFISRERFEQCNTWPRDVIKVTQQCINKRKTRIVEVLKIVFPQLADGFFWQRGEVFWILKLQP